MLCFPYVEHTELNETHPLDDFTCFLAPGSCTWLLLCSCWTLGSVKLGQSRALHSVISGTPWGASLALWGAIPASCTLSKMAPKLGHRGMGGWRQGKVGRGKETGRDRGVGRSSLGTSGGSSRSLFPSPNPEGPGGCASGGVGNPGLCRFDSAQFSRGPGGRWRAQVAPRQHHSGRSCRCTLDARAAGAWQCEQAEVKPHPLDPVLFASGTPFHSICNPIFLITLPFLIN